MVAGHSVVPEQQHDMYCSPVHSPYGGEYYPDSQYYVPGGPPEMCPAHMCTVHGDYGEGFEFLDQLISFLCITNFRRN